MKAYDTVQKTISERSTVSHVATNGEHADIPTYKRNASTAVKQSTLRSFPSILVIVFFCLRLVLNMTGLSQTISNAIIGVLGIIMLAYAVVKHYDNPVITRVILFIFASICVMLTSKFFNGNSGFEDLLWVPVFAGVAIVIFVERIDCRVFKLIVYIASAIFLGCAIVGIDPQNVFSFSSRNGISSYMIFVAAMYYITSEFQKAPILLAPAVLVFLVSVFGEGRAGIVVSSVMLLVVLLFYGIGRKKGFLYVFVSVLLMFGLVLLFVNTELANNIDAIQLRWQKIGTTTSRTEIWAQYLLLVSESIESFLFGAPLQDSFFIVLYNLNLHNSFLMLHAKFGIIGVLFIVVGMLRIVQQMMRSRYWLSILIFLCAIIRSVFDWTSFTGIYDVLWIYLLLEASSGVLVWAVAGKRKKINEIYNRNSRNNRYDKEFAKRRANTTTCR